MSEVYLAEAVRAPVGADDGGLAGAHPADLGGHVLKELLSRTGADPVAVDDVILGCVTRVGPQAMCVARTAWLSAGLPDTVPAVTVDRQCGSSQQAVHFGAQAVLSGLQDLVVVGGVENTGLVPYGSDLLLAEQRGMPHVFGEGWTERYGTQEISWRRAAELIAAKWGLTRSELERYAAADHARAVRARDEGVFDHQIVPVEGVVRDENPRRHVSAQWLARQPLLDRSHVLTSGVCSQPSIGAAALLIASAEAVERHDLTPRARLRAMTVAGDDPTLMLTASLTATQKSLQQANLSIKDIDVFEVHDPVAPIPLAWSKETGAPLARTNPNGGALALGDSVGATGAVLLTKLVHELGRTGGRYGMQVVCAYGGQAGALIVESMT